MSIVTTDCFTGENDISQKCFDDLIEYITTYEKHYLTRLFGADLYDLFIADLTIIDPQIPQTARFIDVFDPFNTDDGSCLRVSEGIKLMLTQFIYFHFSRDQAFNNTQIGFVRKISENSEALNYNSSKLVEVYNRAVTNYHSIQWFICDNSTVYPEDNTQPIAFTSGI